jgi:hypothetical protein
MWRSLTSTGKVSLLWISRSGCHRRAAPADIAFVYSISLIVTLSFLRLSDFQKFLPSEIQKAPNPDHYPFPWKSPYLFDLSRALLDCSTVGPGPQKNPLRGYY